MRHNLNMNMNLNDFASVSIITWIELALAPKHKFLVSLGL